MNGSDCPGGWIFRGKGRLGTAPGPGAGRESARSALSSGPFLSPAWVVTNGIPFRQLRSRTAFTLVELLVVIAIIGVLAALLIPVGVKALNRARAAVTIQRQDQVVQQLKAYSRFEGSVCAALQRACDLGGAHAFARLPDINRIVWTGCESEEPISSYISQTGGGTTIKSSLGRYLPPPCIYVLNAAGGVYFFYPNQCMDQMTQEAVAIWKEVMDVQPPVNGPVWADYGAAKAGNTYVVARIEPNWYTDAWPYVWPKTNWDQDPPPETTAWPQSSTRSQRDALLTGNDVCLPPVLRFPWGSFGLRIDGYPVDGARPATDIVASMTKEFLQIHSYPGGHPRVSSSNLQVPNAWSVYGTITVTGGICLESMSYDELPATEKAAAVYGTRSNGDVVTVKANGRQPFDVGLMSPLRTMHLLHAAGLLNAEADLTGDGKVDRADAFQAYRQDRTPGRPWNDQSGNPLIVAYALFQPERYQSCWKANAHHTNRRALMLQACATHFGYNRALYIVVASLGGEVYPEAAKWTGWPQAWAPDQDARVLRGIWLEARRIARAYEWNEDAQGGDVAPPASQQDGIDCSAWKESRFASEAGAQVVITRPYEIQ